MNTNLAFDLDSLAVDVFSLAESTSSLESLTGLTGTAVGSRSCGTCHSCHTCGGSSCCGAGFHEMAQ